MRVCAFWESRLTSRARRTIHVALERFVFSFKAIACILSTEGPSRSQVSRPARPERAFEICEDTAPFRARKGAL